MTDLFVIAIMLGCAFGPLFLAAYWTQRGLFGYPLTLFAILGATLTIAMFASTRPETGLDPIRAIGVGLYVLVPATAGCVAGGLLGLLIWRRRQKK